MSDAPKFSIWQCAAGHRWIVNAGDDTAPKRCRFCGLPGEAVPVLTAQDVREEQREFRRRERYERARSVAALADFDQMGIEQLRDKLRKKLGAVTITVDVSGMFSEDNVIDAVITLARVELEHEGGSCTYPWHVCDEAIFEEGSEVCWYCDKPESEHRHALICGRDPEEELT